MLGRNPPASVQADSSEEEEDSDEEVEEDDMVSQLMAGMQSGNMADSTQQLQGMINLQMLKELQKLRKGKTKDGSDSSSGSDSEVGTQTKSRLRGILRLRRRLRRKPLKYVKAYTNKIKMKLGAEDERKMWRYSDYSWKLNSRFGKLRTMWRLHYVLSETLQIAVSGNAELTAAFIVQLLKSLHQCAEDGGDWSTASLMLPVEDPLTQDSFGGSPEELMMCHAYKSAMADLKKKKSGGETAEGVTEEEERRFVPKTKAKAKAQAGAAD